MDKRIFLDRLQMQLSDLTMEERREALEYYEEYFADAGEENEEEVIASLGTPEQVAEQIKAGLHKEEEGMFTENGYREKIESDNPPEVYGKKAEKPEEESEKQQDRRGPLPWGNGSQKNKSWRRNFEGRPGNGGGQRSEGARAGGGFAAGQGGYQDGPNGYRFGAERDGYTDAGQGSRSYSPGQDAKKKEGMSGGMIVLLVVLGVLASPVILALGAGLLGVILGLFGTVIGVAVALIVVVIAFLAVGLGLFIGGFSLLFTYPLSGIICIAVGCFMIALFLLCVLLLVLLCSKFFPWLIREVEGLGKYLSRKWSGRKGRGERV